MDTPNARLARVLEILARLAGVHEAHAWQAAERASYAMLFTVDREKHIDAAERLATEAARLAGVPLDGWYTKKFDRNPPPNQAVLVSLPYDIVTEVKVEADGSFPYPVVLAWRPLPEPYRPEEKTDEQR